MGWGRIFSASCFATAAGLSFHVANDQSSKLIEAARYTPFSFGSISPAWNSLTAMLPEGTFKGIDVAGLNVEKQDRLPQLVDAVAGVFQYAVDDVS